MFDGLWFSRRTAVVWGCLLYSRCSISVCRFLLFDVKCPRNRSSQRVSNVFYIVTSARSTLLLAECGFVEDEVVC